MGERKFAELYLPIIDEDPRLRKRTVPMRVLVLGYPRTGTSSIQKALEELGFGPCYHMRVAMNQYPRDCELWLEAFRAKYDGVGTVGKEQWDQLLGNCSSVCDLPGVAFGPELMEAYPDAKVILSNRPVDDWYKSTAKTIIQARKYWLNNVLEHIDWVTALVQPLRRKQWQCLLGGDFETNGKAAMVAHYTEIRKAAQQQQREILELNLGDGWEPLCRFLEVDVPDHPYPRANDSAYWTEKMRLRAHLRLKAAVSRILQLALPLVIASFAAWYAVSR